MIKNDPHHCHCFSIDVNDIVKFREELEKFGFSDTVWQFDDDFEFGLILRIDKYTQIHVKVDSRGCIEGEIEYPPDYPIAHLNQTHSHSAHNELKILLKRTQIYHKSKLYPPMTCLYPKIVSAIYSTHADIILILVICIFYTILKK